ncbi:MAG: DUF1622 domain-containing protein [Cyanobacteriota bacterium]|nr:DUF1622 domain-containing protein [Cyanobacteriota bacterium]
MNLTLISTDLHLFVQVCNGILTSICQLLALVVIAMGVVRALLIFLKETLLQDRTFQAFQKSRLMMGYTFSLGLSFLIGASILKTMISSKWDDIALLVVTIAIRTILNLLLERATRIGQREIAIENNNPEKIARAAS